MKLFIAKEQVAGESRVALVPDVAKRYIKAGQTVLLETQAGVAAGFSDAAFKDAGVEIVTRQAGLANADMVLQFHPPSMADIEQLKAAAVWISFFSPQQNQKLLAAMQKKQVTAFAMDMIPRITRAQSMDALSSQSNLAGYVAVILAAAQLPKIFPLLMTAAGTIQPARVVVLGAGVAGLQAVATAKRLGAVVEVSDVRPAVKEQVESLGARFIAPPADEVLEGAGGYAKQASAAYLSKQRELTKQHLLHADVVITTALVPGKPAPQLIDTATLDAMQPGSVVVDLAVAQGGNCAGAKLGEVVRHAGVTIIGYDNLPGRVPANASEVYARNLFAVTQHLIKEQKLHIDFSDEISAAALLTHAGEKRWQDGGS